jgi:myo-inositol-1(or 4)-monophosphatase
VNSPLESAVEIAREAGALLANYYERHVPLRIERRIRPGDGGRSRIRETGGGAAAVALSAHGIVAEEGGGHTSSSEYRWFVDPLDGTTNFAHSLPIFNVTLALEQAGEMVPGWYSIPSGRRCSPRSAGPGAWLNNRRIGVSAVRQLDSSLLCTGFPSRRRHLTYQRAFLPSACHGHAWRAPHGLGGHRSGVGSVRAAGRVLGIRLNPWDMAAGRLLVAEAGGQVSDMRGQPHNFASPHLLADNGHLHGQILEIFGEVFEGRYPRAAAGHFPLTWPPNLGPGD